MGTDSTSPVVVDSDDLGWDRSRDGKMRDHATSADEEPATQPWFGDGKDD